MNPCPSRRLLAVLAVLFLLPFSAAAAPRDEALRLVPEDVGFCCVVQDLRGHFEALRASPFLEQFQASPLGVALRNANETAKLLEMEKQFRKALQVDWPRLRDDLFGDTIVIAYRPGPPSEPKQEQDLVVLRARDAKLLADLIERLNQLQKDKQELMEFEQRAYRGQTYYRRLERGHENFYFLHGPLLAVSSKEDMLRQAMDRDRQADDGEPPVARQLRKLGADRALLALWLNPRAFDAGMEQKATVAKPAEAAAARAFLAYWKALEGVALAFELGKDAEVVLAVRANTERLPPAARRFFAAAARRSDLWDRFPEDALLAAAGRFEASALFDMASTFLTADDRAALVRKLQGSVGTALDRDAIKEVLPCIGPDCGVCVTAPPTGEKAWFPQVLLAVRVQPGSALPPVDQTLLSALNSYALIAVIDHNRRNKDQLSLKTLRQDRGEVKYLAGGDLPVGVSPAFALRDGYLVLASSPDVIRRFREPRREGPPADEFPVLRVSLKELRRFVQERREPLAGIVADKNQLSREEADRRMTNLLGGLQFFDRLELRQRSGAGQLTLTLHLQPVKPFRQ